MSKASAIYMSQQSDAPIQLVFRVQAGMAEDALLPEGALYRVLNVERDLDWDGKDGTGYKLTASTIEFTEANEPLCVKHFDSWPDDFHRKEMEKTSFWVSGDTDMGERVLDDYTYIDSRKSLLASLGKLAHQARYYTQVSPAIGSNAWFQAVANACLRRGDATSKLSLIIRHLV